MLPNTPKREGWIEFINKDHDSISPHLSSSLCLSATHVCVCARVRVCVCACACVRLVTKLYPTVCNPMDCSLSGSSVHGISQARKLESVAIPFSRGSS